MIVKVKLTGYTLLAYSYYVGFYDVHQTVELVNPFTAKGNI